MDDIQIDWSYIRSCTPHLLKVTDYLGRTGAYSISVDDCAFAYSSLYPSQFGVKCGRLLDEILGVWDFMLRFDSICLEFRYSQDFFASESAGLSERKNGILVAL